MKWMNGCMLLLLLAAYGCAPLVIGGAATEAYKTGTDERSVGRIVDDATITSRVNMAFVQDPVVNTLEIDVDTLEGNVILTGVVINRVEADRAVELAKGVPGVVKVTDNLQIGAKSMGQSFNDKILSSKIKTKLIMEPNIRSLNIDVDVDNGVVTLSGIVDSEKIKQRVIQIARTTNGTRKVVDFIKVTRP
jgi:hyperosmotically inducible protein